MMHQVSILVDNSDCGHKVTAIDWMHDSSHNNKSFSLWNDVFFNQSSTFILNLSDTRLVDFEVPCIYKRMVSLSTLSEDMIFWVLFKLIFNLIHDACKEAFVFSSLHISRASIVGEDFENFFPYELPFCGIIWVLKHFKHFFKPSVSNSLISTLIFDYYIESNKT